MKTMKHMLSTALAAALLLGVGMAFAIDSGAAKVKGEPTKQPIRTMQAANTLDIGAAITALATVDTSQAVANVATDLSKPAAIATSNPGMATVDAQQVPAGKGVTADTVAMVNQSPETARSGMIGGAIVK